MQGGGFYIKARRAQRAQPAPGSVDIGGSVDASLPAPPKCGRSRHIVLLRGWLVSGPFWVEDNAHATGLLAPSLFALTGLLFVLSYVGIPEQ